MEQYKFKPYYIANILGLLVIIVLIIGIISKLLSIKEIITFSLICSLCFVISFDIKKERFNKNPVEFPFKYGLYIVLFGLL
ncbi:hypothetical protein ACM26V_03225 [Salipaludibacillus sp. HK11]|uniref:hypothetical protein n=1 Tax=Salipaludibacillus sp. HK11 TaxID=3394320 RepID=UPI0039FD1F75